jgi:hypothetical protein
MLPCSFELIKLLADCHRSTDEATQQQLHSADEGSGDASEYAPTPREIKKGANRKSKGTKKPRGPYMTQRKRAELRASEDAQVMVKNSHLDIGRRASASAEHPTPLVNDKNSPDDQSREVIDLEARREVLGPDVEAADPSAGRCRKRRAAAVRSVPAKRPQRAEVVNRVRKYS